MNKLLITGTGMVSPIGTGKDGFWNAIESGSAGIGKLTRFSLAQDILCGEIRDFDLGDYISDRRFRRAAPISQFAIATTAMALEEAGAADNGDDTALVMAITHGALGYAQAFHRDLIEGGPEAVSPIFFSDSVLNAPAGNISICFGIKGPVHTILGGPETTVKSIMTACRMLSDEEIKKAIVVSAEELNEFSLFCYTRLGFSPLSEGAGTIIIEREGAGAQSTPYCRIAGVASMCNPSDPDAALENSLNLCMDSAGLWGSDIDLVMVDSKASRNQILKGIPAATLTPFTGNAFATSVLWEVVYSAMAIRKDRISKTLISRGGAPPARIKNVLVCTADGQGNAAAILLTKHV
ncbi:MAG: beta-ketoacyl synthase N-terminal-like domain-containing protein [Dissulfurispiraceae bacterium]